MPSLGLGDWKWAVGGISCRSSTITALMSPVTPAATSRWPMLALIAPNAQKPTRCVYLRLAPASACFGPGFQASLDAPLRVPNTS